MNPLACLLIIGSLIGVGGAIAADHHAQDSQTVIVIPNSSYRDITLQHAEKINNSVCNMLGGRESASSIQYLIEVEYRGTNHDTTNSKEEIDIDGRYRDYLNTAYNVANDYSQNSKSLDEDIKIMNEKKNLI